jgi:mono/diheme cytochrome c family protein
VFRAALNYTIAGLLAMSLLGLAFTGIHMGFVIPADINALWGVSHRWWARVHLYIALAFMVFAVAHFALHWDALAAASRRSRLRSMRGWSVVVVGAAFVVVYAGLRLAPARAQVSRGTGLGRRVYLAQECDLCHAIDGVGGTMGPDLSHAGARRDRSWLAEEITNPDSHQPGSRMPAHELSKKELDALAGYLAALK